MCSHPQHVKSRGLFGRVDKYTFHQALNIQGHAVLLNCGIPLITSGDQIRGGYY
jgi:hypothetical protein